MKFELLICYRGTSVFISNDINCLLQQKHRQQCGSIGVERVGRQLAACSFDSEQEIIFPGCKELRPNCKYRVNRSNLVAGWMLHCVMILQ